MPRERQREKCETAAVVFNWRRGAWLSQHVRGRSERRKSRPAAVLVSSKRASCITSRKAAVVGSQDQRGVRSEVAVLGSQRKGMDDWYV
jgi:mRNA-degrading endonuclease toxin of MazEF toxin-antitoxin module